MTKEIKLSKNELGQLFPPGNFRLTNVSLFSISPPDHSIITKYILESFYSKYQLKKRVYVDGTSNVGGNIFPLIPLFKQIIAIEFDKLTYTLLKHNLKLFNGNIKILNEDFTKFDYNKYKPNILFLDPPWGGINYKTSKDKELYLSNIPLSKLANKYIKKVELIILRVPTKYPTKNLQAKFFKQVKLNTSYGRTIYKLVILSNIAPKKYIKGSYIVKAVPYKKFKIIS